MIAGFINTRIILAVMFLIIMMPIVLVLKLFGNDLLKHKLDNKQESYCVIKDPQDKEHMERPC